MRIAYENKIDYLIANTTIISSSTENPNYPLSNIQDERLSTKYRTTGLTSMTVLFNFSYLSEGLNTIAILGSNLTSNATMTLDLNIANVWPGDSTDFQTITWNDDVILCFFTIDTTNYEIDTESSEKITTEDGYYITTEKVASNLVWAKLTIADSVNPDGYMELGRIWIGSYIQIDPSSLLGFKVAKQSSDNVIHGKNRQKWASKGITWRKFEFSFPSTNEAMVVKLDAMYDYSGNHGSLIFCNFDTIRGYTLVEPCYCSIVGDIKFSNVEKISWEYDLILEEER
jgi:hypothetical protein